MIGFTKLIQNNATMKTLTFNIIFCFCVICGYSQPSFNNADNLKGNTIIETSNTPQDASSEFINLPEEIFLESHAIHLPNGIYYLCCKNGDLILYNNLGSVVGWGPDCGGIPEGHCIRCILYTPDGPPPCSGENPPDEDDVKDLLNSLSSSSGEDHEGEFCTECATYCFSTDEIGQ